MTGTPATGLLLYDLVTRAHADRVNALAVAAVIEHRDRLLLAASPNHDPDTALEPPTDLVHPGETLLDALHRITTLATGLTIDHITGYLGHRDHTHNQLTRVFWFAVTVADPAANSTPLATNHRPVANHQPPSDLTHPPAQHRAQQPTNNPVTSHQTPERLLTEPLRAHARGIPPDEAAIELLISHNVFLRRNDFTDHFVQPATHPTSSARLATIDWPAAITALDYGHLPCSSTQEHILRLAASLAENLPINLRDTLTGIDNHSIKLVIAAVLHATGQRPTPTPHLRFQPTETSTAATTCSGDTPGPTTIL